MPQALTLSPVIRNYGFSLGAPSESGLSRLSLRGQPCDRNLYCVHVCVGGGGAGSGLL